MAPTSALRAVLAGLCFIGIALSGPVRADGDDKTLPVKLTVNGQSTDLSGVVDPGSTSEKDNLPGKDFRPPATTIDRATAQKLGLLDDNGDPDPDLYEKAANGDILGVQAKDASGATSVSAVS